mgnify:CR=1 FL=1|tara:strand:+ start:49 stop:309 length:261 start_codon:yes stop_codon:yes gene_type:complete
MCFGAPSPPPAPPRMQPAPPLKAVAPPSDIPVVERLRDEDAGDEKVSTRRKKALEIKRVQRGVKEFGSIDAATMPQSPVQGINNPK